MHQTYTHLLEPTQQAALNAAQSMLRERQAGRVYAAIRIGADKATSSLKGEDYPATYVGNNETHIFWRSDSPLLQDVIDLCRELDFDVDGITLGKLVRRFCTERIELFPHKYRWDDATRTRTERNQKANCGFYGSRYYRIAKTQPTTHWHYLLPNNQSPLMSRPDWIVNVDIKGAYFASLINGSKSLILHENAFSLNRNQIVPIRTKFLKQFGTMLELSRISDLTPNVIESFLGCRPVAASDFELLCRILDCDWRDLVSPNLSNPKLAQFEWRNDNGALDRLRSHAELFSRYKRFRLALLGVWAQYEAKWFTWDKSIRDEATGKKGAMTIKAIPDIAWGGVFNCTHAAVWRLERQMEYVHRTILGDDCVGANTDAFWIRASCPESKLDAMKQYLADRGYELTVKRWGHGFVWDASTALVLQPDATLEDGIRAIPVGEPVEVNDALKDMRWWNVERQDLHWKQLVKNEGVPDSVRNFERFGLRLRQPETIA